MAKYYIREWRKAKGFGSLADLVETLSHSTTPVPESTLKKIENGQTKTPHLATLDAIAAALGTTRARLLKPPDDVEALPSTASRRRARASGQAVATAPTFPHLPYQLPSPDAPGIDDDERRRRTAERQRSAEQWREVLEVDTREHQGGFEELRKSPFTPAERRVVLSVMDGGAPVTIREALIFVGIASLVFAEMNSHADDSNAHKAFLVRLHSIVADACRFGELRWLVDGSHGPLSWQLQRETSEAGLQAYERAGEAWQDFHAMAVQAWAEQSTPWDGGGERLLYNEAAPSFRVSPPLIGNRND